MSAGITITNSSDATRTLLSLRRMGGGGNIPIVVITSCELRDLAPPAPATPLLHLFAMWDRDGREGCAEAAAEADDVNVCSIEIDKIDAALTGASPSFHAAARL